MENKQTAVNFLIEQIIDKQPAGFYVIDSQEECYKLFEKARQIEKEQIIEAWDKACTDQNRIGKEYYRDTYENKT